MKRCYRCGEWVDPESDGPCHDGKYYCFECILGNKCGCSIDIKRLRGLLGRIWNAVRGLRV